MASVKLKTIIEWIKLDNLTPEIPIDKIRITQPDINRPALQLAGYFEHFEATRLQIVGFVEYTYMESLPQEQKEKAYRDFLSFDIPAVIFCRELVPDNLFLKIANEEQVPVLMTRKPTSAVMAEIIRYLNEKLAPCISISRITSLPSSICFSTKLLGVP